MSYNGTIELISGIKAKNNGSFPLMDAKDVYLTDDVRLDGYLLGNGVIEETSLRLVNTGYVVSNGATNSEEYAMNTGYVSLKNATKLVVKTHIVSDSFYAVAFYDANYQFLSSISIHTISNYTETTIDLTSDTYSDVGYVTISCYDFQKNFNRFSAKLSSYAPDLRSELSKTSTKLNTLLDGLSQEEIVTSYPLTDTGYVNSSGNVNTQQDAKNTGYIDVTGASKIDCFVRMGNAAPAIAMYDSAKVYMSDISVMGRGGQVAYSVDLTDAAYKDVKYIIVSYYDADGTYFGYYTKVTSITYSTAGSGGGHERTFSIIGDSLSTFSGYMKNENAACYYPASSADVKSVEQTWWWKFANKYGCRLLENEAWSGSTIGYDGYADGTDDANGYDHTPSFLTRMGSLTTPELIFVVGGTNDAWNAEESGRTDFLGDYKYTGFSESDFIYFRPALAYLLDTLRHKHIGAKIVFVHYGSASITESIDTICGHYGIGVVKLTDIEKVSNHPTEAGMTSFANQILEYLGSSVVADDLTYTEESNVSGGTTVTIS